VGGNDNTAQICSLTAQIPESFDFADLSELKIGEDTFRNMEISLSIDDEEDSIGLVVDDAIQEWYYERYKILLPPGSLMELSWSIQGHPDAGRNWQEKVNLVFSSMNWSSLIHEPCLY